MADAKRMIIVGASGVIGNALFQQARSSKRDVIGTYYNHQREGLLRYDMRQAGLSSVVPGIGPQDTVYLLSSYTNVAWIYAHQDKAIELNVQATKRLIDEAAQAGARIIFMSSVEVFDGEQGNYNENSLPNPLTFYGRMKFDIEQHLLKEKNKSCIVRFGWNISWDIDSPCAVKFTYQTLLRPDAKMARDNVSSVIDIRDNCEGLLRLAERPDIRICHLASTPPVVRTELASLVMKYSKYKDRMSYKTVTFADIPYSEKRSRDTHLDNSFAVSSLGMSFRPPENIIRQKVELLDQHFKKVSQL